MNIVVYTALFGNKDKLWSPYPPVVGGCKHICFSERPRRQVGLWSAQRQVRKGSKDLTAIPIWEVRVVPIIKGARYSARYYKALSHIHFPNATFTIWVDANVRLLITPKEAIIRWLRQGVLATFDHPNRRCLFEEIQFCKRAPNKGDPRKLEAQAVAYHRAKMPLRWGLAETKCVIRPNKPETNLLNEAWWEETQKHSVRDQVSLPYTCWTQGVHWKVIPGRAWTGSDEQTNQDFWFTRHAS